MPIWVWLIGATFGSVPLALTVYWLMAVRERKAKLWEVFGLVGMWAIFFATLRFITLAA